MVLEGRAQELLAVQPGSGFAIRGTAGAASDGKAGSNEVETDKQAKVDEREAAVVRASGTAVGGVHEAVGVSVDETDATGGSTSAIDGRDAGALLGVELETKNATTGGGRKRRDSNGSDSAGVESGEPAPPDRFGRVMSGEAEFAALLEEGLTMG